MMNPCIFCKIGAKQIDSDLMVYENEHVFAQISLHQKPNNHGHVLVIPKLHVQDIYALPAELDAPLMSALRLLAGATKKAFDADGIHIRQNNEAASGQEVFHIHYHIIPRYHGDKFDSSSYEEIPREQREEMAVRLKEMLLYFSIKSN